MGAIIPHDDVGLKPGKVSLTWERTNENFEALDSAVANLPASLSAISCRLAKVDSGDIGSGNLSIPSGGAGTDITFSAANDEIEDDEGLHDPTTDPEQIVINRAGKIDINASATFQGNAAGKRRIAVLKNGFEIASKDLPAADSSIMTVDTNAFGVQVAANDIIKMRVFQDSGIALNVLSSPLTAPSQTRLEICEKGTTGDFSAFAPPAGVMSPFAGASSPTGWLMCDGAAISRTTFADLFAVVSTTYGVGDGSTTFNVPDMRGRVPMGVDGSAGRITSASNGGSNADTLGGAGGAETHLLSFLESGLPVHDHVQTRTIPGTGGGANKGITPADVSPATSEASYLFTGSNSGVNAAVGHSNTPPWLAINWIIKT